MKEASAGSIARNALALAQHSRRLVVLHFRKKLALREFPGIVTESIAGFFCWAAFRSRNKSTRDASLNRFPFNNGSIESTDDPIEEDQPGRIVFLNDDDDNGNNTPDRDEQGPITGEDDLALTKLSVWDGDGPNGTNFDLTGYKVKLETVSSNIKLWTSASKGTSIPTGTTYDLGVSWPYVTPEQIYVEGYQTGTATLDLALLNPNNQEVHRDTVRFTVIDLDLQKVSFSGTGYRTVYSDDGNDTYIAPHWIDNNLDGDADDPGDEKEPVAFVSGTTMQLETVIAADGIGQIPGDVYVRGMVLNDSSYNINFDEQVKANLGAGTITLPATPAANPFPANVVNAFNTMDILWQVKFDAVGQWWTVGQSDNRLYVTWKAPINNRSVLHHTLVHLGSTNAAGQTTRAGIIDKVWADFELDKKVYRVDGQLLTYYKDWECTNTTTAALLKNGDGQCGAWAGFFLDILKMQGIDQPDDYWQVKPIDQNGETHLLVNDWVFGGLQSSGDPNFPRLNVADGPDKSFYEPTNSYEWLYAEVNDAIGISGQGDVSNPASLFKNHQFVLVDPDDDNGVDTPGSRPPIFYDPSYGVTYTSLSEFDNGYIKAYALEKDEHPVDESVIFTDLNEDGDTDDTVVSHVFFLRVNAIPLDVERDPDSLMDY